MPIKANLQASEKTSWNLSDRYNKVRKLDLEAKEKETASKLLGLLHEVICKICRSASIHTDWKVGETISISKREYNWPILFQTLHSEEFKWKPWNGHKSPKN